MLVVAVRRAALAAVVGVLALSPFPATSAPAPARPAGSTSRLSTPLPDTVLARVFTGTGTGQQRDVTSRQLGGALAKAGKRVDLVTPQERRQFLDLLLDQTVLVARVKQEPRRWDHRDSTDWNTLRDRLVLRAALDSAMVELNFERMGRGDSLLGRQELGQALRDRALRQIAPAWNDAGLRKAVSVFDTLPRPDASMSMLEQMRVAGARPTVGAADSALLLVESSEGNYTLGDLVRDYGRLNPLYRPRIATADDVRGFAGNTLFENQLRRLGVERGLEQRPAIRAQLAERAEYLDVSRFVAREVYAKIPMDSATIRRHFEATRSEYDFDAKATVVNVVLAAREEAAAMAARLASTVEAESLVARSARAGTPYQTVLTERADTTLFRRLRRGGVGVVLGPDSTAQGWRVLRLQSLEPRRPRTFAEAEGLAKQHWYEVEGERRMRELLDGLRSRAVFVVNDRALARPLSIPNVRVVR